MIQRTVLHFQKMNQGRGAGPIGKHIDRTAKNPAPNIDQSRSDLNREFSPNAKGTLGEDVKRRIAEGYTLKNKDGSQKKIQKNANHFVNVVLSGSHERMTEIGNDPKLLKAWVDENYRYCCEQFGGEKNIVRFTLHMDEKTPHVHCVFVPITEHGSLSAMDFIDGRKKLRNFQTTYALAIKKFGLERGLPVEQTGNFHLTTKEWLKEILAEGDSLEHIAKNLIEQNKMFNPNIKLTNKKMLGIISEMSKTIKKNESRASFSEKALKRTEKLQEELKSGVSYAINRNVNLLSLVIDKGWKPEKEEEESVIFSTEKKNKDFQMSK